MTEHIETPSSIATQDSWYLRNWRWWVLGTLFLATFLNYFDRQTLGAAISPIREEFGLDNELIGKLLSAFLLTYAIAHLFIGVLLDRMKGIRWFFPVMVLGWSLTTIFAGLAKNFEQLISMRYLLGIWEAVNFPICIMIIGRIFPARERSLASGIFASGAFLATLIAPKVVIFFSNTYTWRYSFIFAGLLGVIWLAPWFLIFRNPEKRAHGWDQQRVRAGGRSLNLGALKQVILSPGFWGVALMGIGIIPSLYFATQWLPWFLETNTELSYDQKLGNSLMFIYLMQDGGLWIGGAIVLGLVNRSRSVLGSRKAVIGIGWLLMLSILVVPMFQSTLVTILLFCLFTFGIGMFLGNQHAFKQDVVKSQTATVAAWVGFIEMMFTHYVIKRVGIITNETADFTPVFLLLGGLATFALVVVFLLIRRRWMKIE